MFSSIKSIALLASLFTTAHCSIHQEIPFPRTHIKPSHDAFIRKDNHTKQHGHASKITVTQKGSNQRIGLMQFDTAHYDEEVFDENDIKAYLRLGVAETHSTGPVDVKVLRLQNGFDESDVSWHNFDGDAIVDHYVKFTVESDHVNKLGQVDVSDLLVPGEDTVFAFIIEDGGHVKFHSKENSSEDLSPSLILSYGEL